VGDVIRRKFTKYAVLFMICITALLVWIGYLWQDQARSKKAIGDIRVEINHILSAWEHGQEYRQASGAPYVLPYCIFDLNGVVIDSSIQQYSVGQRVDLHTIGDHNRYIVPLRHDDSSEAILMVDMKAGIDQYVNRYRIYKIGLLIILWLFFLRLVYKVRKILNNNIYKPLHELHHSTKAILAGDLNAKVHYEYEGEIGMLCHDFEKMRDELESYRSREILAREKEQLLYASISHDLKTPLATIMGYLEEIIHGVVKTPEKTREYLERVLNKVMVISKMIDDILKHSKAQLKELTIQRSEVYAREYFEKMLVGYKKDAEQADYQFTYELPENVLLSIDADRIEEVVQNLIDNAVKYREDSLHIEVSFALIEEPEKFLIVNIKDNGKGIDAVDMPFIFDKFYRGDKARTQSITGSGLGLNICKYIIEQHGGRIECDSIAGKGTTMSFSIPCC
jgi:signal transduction histidine kinase